MTDVGHIEFFPQSKPPDWVGPAHVHTGHQDARIRALEAELAAWREVGEILDAKNFYCMVCGGGTSRTKEGHRPDCKLAALLGRKP